MFFLKGKIASTEQISKYLIQVEETEIEENRSQSFDFNEAKSENTVLLSDWNGIKDDLPMSEFIWIYYLSKKLKLIYFMLLIAIYYKRINKNVKTILIKYA